MSHLILHFFGLDSASGPAYLAWSGVLSDLGEVTLLAAVCAWLRHRNCHVHRCWRLGRFTAGPHVVCRRHHPTGAPKAHEIGGTT